MKNSDTARVKATKFDPLVLFNAEHSVTDGLSGCKSRWDDISDFDHEHDNCANHRTVISKH